MQGRIGGKYRLVRRIGSGSFGEVYRGMDVHSGLEVAVKLEPIRSRHPQLLHEARIYKLLVGGVGVPKLYWYGTQGDFNVMVIDLLAPSLEDLCKFCGGRFTLKTVLLLMDQMVERVEWLHAKNIIHRDIKPENFLIGQGRQGNLLHIIDFGLATMYRDRRTQQHLAYRGGRSFIGTARFASLNVHRGIEQSRRDDLESIGYSALYLLRGDLPWMRLKVRTCLGSQKQHKYALIGDSKADTPLDVLCPIPELREYLTYCRDLQFTERPNYAHLRRLLKVFQVSQHAESLLSTMLAEGEAPAQFERDDCSDEEWEQQAREEAHRRILALDAPAPGMVPHPGRLTRPGRSGGSDSCRQPPGKDTDRILASARVKFIAPPPGVCVTSV
jgi:casein kinase 1